jgi:DNA primase
MDVKDEIRARLPIDQLVAQYCQLKRKGRNFVCVCPFHNDTHPSFLVSPDKGIAYCFACQSGGDIFSFYQKIESVDFPTALKALAEKANVELPKEQFAQKPSVSKDQKERLRDCLIAAQKFFQEKMYATPKAIEYVRGRGVSDDLIKKFGIGFAPDSYSATYDHLLKLSFSRSEIVAAGLGIQKELEGRFYDRFRNRIMFSITDAQGNLVGFGGRTMGDDDAKYVNSPESPLYNKSSILFGLFQARDAIRKAKSIVLVEGYFDAIASHKAGIENVVAVSGTALTDEHVKIIRRYAEKVTLCLDQDNAGQLAAGRAFDLLCRANLQIESVSLPAKDPDELVQRDASMFHTLITTSAIPYVDAVIQRLRTRPNINDPAGKRVIADALFPLLAALPTSMELRAYIAKAAQEFGLIENEMHADFRRWKMDADRGSAMKKQSLAMTAYSRQQLCLGLALLYPQVRALLAEMILEETDPMFAVRTAIQVITDLPAGDLIDTLQIDQSEKEKL